MKWKNFIGLWICLVSWNSLSAQHFIGRNKSEVRELMAEYRKELMEDKSSVNRVYNIVKYVDGLQNQTMLFVFTDDDICQYTKWMCDYSMISKVLAELNESYGNSAGNTWHYTHQGESYTITLTKGDWFFTVTTRKLE